MDIPKQLFEAVANQPWMVGVIVVCVALSYFITKVAPALTDLFKAIMNTQSQDEILKTLTDVREDQQKRYKANDIRNERVDKRLNNLEVNQKAMTDDINLLKDAVRSESCECQNKES